MALNPLGAVESELTPTGRGECGWALHLESLCQPGPGLGLPFDGSEFFAGRLCTKHGVKHMASLVSGKLPPSLCLSLLICGAGHNSHQTLCQALSARCL